MRIVAAAAVAVAASRAGAPAAPPLPTAKSCSLSRRTTPGIAASTRCRSRPDRPRRSQRSGRRRRCTPTSARGSGTAARSGSRSRSSARARRRARSGSTTPTSPTAGPYPIPRGVKIEGGPSSDGDRHALIVDRDACRLYELFALRRDGCALDGGVRRDLGPPLEPAAPGGLDVRRRGRVADPARARPLRRGREGPDRPRASLHGVAHETGIRLAGAALASSLTDPRCRRWAPGCG